MSRAREAAEQWLKEQGIIAELDDQQYEEVRKLIGNPGFGIFWALLRYRAEQNGYFLRNASLGTPERACAASVLQGHIREIDGIRELILSLADPEAAAGDKEEQVNG